MRLLSFLAFLISASLIVAANTDELLDENGNPAGFQTLAIGDPAPDFNLPGIDGIMHRLDDYAGTDVLMVMFTSNHCPTSHGIEMRLQELYEDFKDESFHLVTINPNHPEGLSIDELGFGEFDDSFEDMIPYAAKNGWTFPYLYDGETQMVARAYGCLATPHVFVFDRDRKLRYAGRFDDSRYPDPSTVKSPDARNAVNALLAGNSVPVELTRPFGCSTKWREKKYRNEAKEAEWKELPVSIEKIDAAGIAELRRNDSDNLRLFNLWATWCAPCVEEFPDLVEISRQYDMRPFELITISLDDPKMKGQAQKFLERQGAGETFRGKRRLAADNRSTNHYLYDSADQDALGAALDPEWPGPIPHSVLVAPGGEIVWRFNGQIDTMEAKEEIVKILTPYWPQQDD